LYVAVNAGAGFFALYLVRAFGWTFGQTSHVDLWRVLIAGFGAVAVFRSSLFVARIGGNDVNVGPAMVLGALLDTFDRAVDRKSANELSGVLQGDDLQGLDPDTVIAVLPVLCLALMQNFSQSDQALLGTELNKISVATGLSSDAKMRAVVINLAKFLGPPLVTQVLKCAKTLLSQPPITTVPPPTEPGAVLEAARKAGGAGAGEAGGPGRGDAGGGGDGPGGPPPGQ
jgi:hypothetical protein